MSHHRRSDLFTLIAVAIFLAISPSLFAQGEVYFGNNVLTPPPDRLVRRPDGQGLIGMNWRAQLYYGEDESSLRPVMASPRPFYSGATTLPGWWVGATHILDGFSGGDTATLQVRVWDSALFPDFDAAVRGGGLYGQSIPFSYTVPTVIIRGDEVWMHNFQGFTLVPEPSVFALAALGGVIALAWYRQR